VAITTIEFGANSPIDKTPAPEIINRCKQQLDQYFIGKRDSFDFPIELNGTDFQKTVWQELRKIPLGTLVSYKDIAESIGNPKAVRAVGNANNNNSIPIIIPCHRVVGNDGKMVGYAGGLWRKEWLIKHEKAEL
jgi:methylated-DNA-[protein]-cysteine S-methyltransferase